MAWSQVQYTANTTHLTSGSTASIVINATSTPTSGNLLIALVWAYKYGGPAPTYSGLGSWVHIGQIYPLSSGNVVGDIFYYVAGSSEPSTWTITSSNVQFYGAEFYEYSGNSATPLDVSSFVNVAGTLTPSTSLTLTNANELVVYGVVCTSTVTSLTLPTGFSSGHTDLGQNPGWGDGFKVFTSSGATGAQTATLVGSSVCAVMMVAFAPASGGITHPLSLSVTLSPTAKIVKQIQTTKRVTLTLTPKIIKQISKRLSVTLSPTASMSRIKLHLLTLIANVTPVAKIIKQIQLSRKVVLAPTAKLIKHISKSLKATVSLTATLKYSRVHLMTLVATLNPTASIKRHIAKTLKVTVPLTAKITKYISKHLTVNLAPTAVMHKQISKTLKATLSLLAKLVTAVIHPGQGEQIYLVTTMTNELGLTVTMTNEDGLSTTMTNELGLTVTFS